MDNKQHINVAGRIISVSQRVLDMLVAIEEESQKRGINVSPYMEKLVSMAYYYRNEPDYVLTCLKPILEMAKNNISPAYAFELIEMYAEISEKATHDAKVSRSRRMAQESRIAATHEKRKLFKKIKEDYDRIKQEKSVVSLPMLIEKYFPEAKDNDRIIENLRQQYYRAIRCEEGVKKNRISNKDALKQEFLDYYLLNNFGRIEEINGVLTCFNIRNTIGKSRSRISTIIDRERYEEKLCEYLSKRMKYKKKK